MTILKHLPSEDEIQKKMISHIQKKDIVVFTNSSKTVWHTEPLKVPYDPQFRGGVRYALDEVVERIKGDVHGRF